MRVSWHERLSSKSEAKYNKKEKKLTDRLERKKQRRVIKNG